jgi:hypothetical protein
VDLSPDGIRSIMTNVREEKWMKTDLELAVRILLLEDKFHRFLDIDQELARSNRLLVYQSRTVSLGSKIVCTPRERRTHLLTCDETSNRVLVQDFGKGFVASRSCEIPPTVTNSTHKLGLLSWKENRVEKEGKGGELTILRVLVAGRF